MPDPKHLHTEDENIAKPIEAKIPPEATHETGEQHAHEKTPTVPEGVVEVSPEKPKTKEDENFLEESISGLKNKLRGTKKKKTSVPQVRDNLTVEIEKIMEDGLADAFRELTPIQKQEFKIKGEQTAFEIRALLKKTHVKAKTIFKLIFEWLKTLPGINKFFLEQEAKIKTDKIVTLKRTSGK